ncbi:MAG: hypothetical protein RSA27_05010 [Oscillospiraceae bacterium]
MRNYRKNQTESPTSTSTLTHEQPLVMPPGCHVPSEYDGEFSTYIPTCTELSNGNCCSCNTTATYSTPSLSNGMNGKYAAFSVPNKQETVSSSTLTEYLGRYKGKYICIDFWTTNRIKMEKCGILKECGQNFLSMQDVNSKNMVIVDLNQIRYISVYCR